MDDAVAGNNRGSDLRRGAVPLLGYAALTAAMDVYAGNRLEKASPASIAAISFTLTTLFFFAVEGRRQGFGRLGELRAHRRDLVAINITTAVTWLSTLYALDFLEPAIVNVLGLALGPVVTVLAGPLLRRSGRALPTEVVTSVAICGVLAALMWVSLSGRSGLTGVTPTDAVLGLSCTLVCAIGSSFNIIYMKRLSDAGCPPGSVLAVRFFLMSVVAWLIVAGTDRAEFSEALVPGVVVALIGVGLPISVLQVGIRHTEPITTSLVISLSPLFAFAMQFADGRLRFSLFTLAGIVCVVALVAVGAVVRDRHPQPAGTGSTADLPADPGPGTSADRKVTVPRGDRGVGVAAARSAARSGAGPQPSTPLCAIVDAYGAGRLLPAALRVRGVGFVHVRSQFPDTRLSYWPEDFTVDIQHTGNVAATAAALRELGVSEVTATAESGVLLADQLSAALGVPGNALDRSVARRDKFVMQEVVRAAGLRTAENLCSASVDETVTWVVDQGRWPVVLKPVLSAGTDNVIVCGSVDEVVAAHHRIMASTDRYGRRNDTVLAQQYLRGAEHYVNTVSRDGAHRVVEVWRYHKRTIDGRSVYDYEDLLSLDDPGAQDVVHHVRAVLDALGISNGAAHTEVMLTEDGPFLIECGARLGGGQMPDLLTRCVGADQVDTLAFSIADPESFLAEADAPYQLKSCLRCVNLICPAEGAVPAEEGWERVRRLTSFAALVVNHPAGTPLTRTVDMATCPGTVYLNSDDPFAVREDYRTLRDMELDGLYG